MLASDALTVLRETDRARTLLLSVTSEERSVADAGEVLADAALRARCWREALALIEDAPETENVRRIRAAAELESGGLYEQNRALETLDELIASRGREAHIAALHRVAATFGRRRAQWSEDAFNALIESGHEDAAISGRALYLARRGESSEADAVLAPYEGAAWADAARLAIAIRREDREAARALASDFLRRDAVQEDRVECALGLALGGETERARDLLTIVARDGNTAPAIRADAYSLLVTLIADELNDWDAAEDMHTEWVELRPQDGRASAWFPRIVNQKRQRS
jgi:hypothetical protein